MNFRTTLVILAVFVGLLAAWFVVVDRPVPEQGETQETLSDRYAVAKDQVSRFRLEYQAESLMPVNLAKVGNTWRITEPIEADADDDKISEVISDLLDKRIKRTIESPSDLSTYGLADPTITIRLWTDGEQPAATFLIGEKAVSYSAYLKEADASVVHTVESSILDDLTQAPTDLRQRRLLVFTREDVQSLTLRSEGGQGIALARGTDGWVLQQPVQAEVDTDVVHDILDALKALRAETFEADRVNDLETYGLSRFTVELQLKEARHRLRLGRTIPDSQRMYAMVDGRGNVVGVDVGLLAKLDRSVYDLRDKSVIDFQRTDVTRFEIEREDGTIRVVKESDGSWQIQEPVAYEADSAAVDDLLFELDALQATEFVDDTPTSLADYGLASPGFIVRIYTAQEGEPTRLKLGASRGGQVYAQGDKAAVYLVSDAILEPLERGVPGLRDRLFWEFSASDVQNFALSYDDTRIEATKQGTVWQLTAPISQKADTSAVQDLLNKVATLRVHRYLASAPDAGLDQPRLRLELTLDDGPSRVLAIGSSAGPGERYARADSDPMLLVVPESLLSDLRKSVEDLRETAS